MKKNLIFSIIGLLPLLVLVSCSTSQPTARVETLVYDMFTAPVAYMEKNHELFRGYAIGEGAPTPSQEELDSLTEQIQIASKEFEASYKSVPTNCTESGSKNFFSTVTEIQWISAEFAIPVQVQSVSVETLSKENCTYRFTATLLVNNRQTIEVTGKMQTNADGLISFIDARKAKNITIQAINDEINSKFSTYN